MYISEVENYPRTIYSKSVKQTDLQMRLHSLAGVSEFTLNLFDHFQTPINMCMEYLNLLKDNKPIYRHIKHLRERKNPAGVAFPWKKDICAKLINRSGSPRDCVPRSNLDTLLPNFGIPVKHGVGKVNCIEGDKILCFSPDEIKNTLLNKGLILDRIAAEHLCNMGFGNYIGVSSPKKLNTPCYEQFTDKCFSGDYTGQYMTVYMKSTGEKDNIPYVFESSDGAKVISRFIDGNKNTIAPAVILFENELGGRICVFSSAIVRTNWIYKSRAYQVRRIIEWAYGGKAPLIVENAVNVAPIYYEDKVTGEGLLALVNIGSDTEYPVLKTNKNFKDTLGGETSFTLPPFEVKFYICGN